jgi:hypothetical protein
MVPLTKILLQIMNGLHTNHFCSMGTIMKFVINMEGLDADLERIWNRLTFFLSVAVAVNCIQLIVDCFLCLHHCCHCRCLFHRHRGGAWWQNGGCRGHARRRRAANALPAVAAAAVLPASCRCRQAAAATAATALPPHFPPCAAADDAALPPRCQAGRHRRSRCCEFVATLGEREHTCMKEHATGGARSAMHRHGFVRNRMGRGSL